MNHFIIESLLGITLRGDKLLMNPCLPADWPSLKIRYRYRTTFYSITIERITGKKDIVITVDGKKGTDNIIQLADDQAAHSVSVYIG